VDGVLGLLFFVGVKAWIWGVGVQRVLVVEGTGMQGALDTGGERFDKGVLNRSEEF